MNFQTNKSYIFYRNPTLKKMFIRCEFSRVPFTRIVLTAKYSNCWRERRKKKEFINKTPQYIYVNLSVCMFVYIWRVPHSPMKFNNMLFYCRAPRSNQFVKNFVGRRNSSIHLKFYTYIDSITVSLHVELILEHTFT